MTASHHISKQFADLTTQHIELGSAEKNLRFQTPITLTVEKRSIGCVSEGTGHVAHRLRRAHVGCRGDSKGKS